MTDCFGRYRVLSKLGQGAMAAVYLAEDPVLSRLVAVKALHPALATRQEVLRRFFKEARTVAAIRNPHVVEVYDFGQEGDAPYLVMEYVDGMSLRAVFQPAGPVKLAGPGNHGGGPALTASPGSSAPTRVLDSLFTASLVCQAAEGLAAAAEHGVVHRDIKPENLLLNRQGFLKIADFGIAHVHDDNYTKTGAILGSPLFMSPEQARGAKPITAHADLFSLGAVMYACLAGKPPFHAPSIPELLRRIASDPHVPLGEIRPDLDARFAGLVDGLLNKDPLLRGAGPRHLHRELQALLAGEGILDPAERVAACLKGLSREAGLGHRVPTEPDSVVTTALATLAGIPIPIQGPVRGKLPAYGSKLATLLLLLGTVGTTAGIWKMWKETPRVSYQVPHDAVRPRNAALTVGPLGGPVPSGSDEESPGSSPGPVRRKVENPREIPSLPKKACLLEILSAPPFAEIYIDGDYTGITPLRVRILPGRHRIALRGKSPSFLDTLVAVRSGSQVLRFRLDRSQSSMSPEGVSLGE